MWTDARQATAWAFVWLLLVTAGFVLLRPRSLGGRWPRLPLIPLLAPLVRLPPALWLPVGAGLDIAPHPPVPAPLPIRPGVYGARAGPPPPLTLPI